MESQGTECKVDKVEMGRQGVMNKCWEDKNRLEQRGKELGDRDTERKIERVMEDGGWEQG